MQWSTVDAVIELRGSPITEYPILGSHVPFVIIPMEVVEVVKEVAEEKLLIAYRDPLAWIKQVCKLFVLRDQHISNLSELFISHNVP
jgi:hypothetical protein